MDARAPGYRVGMTSTRPVIGICSALERARWSHWDQPAHLTPVGYVTAVQRAGGLAILLPVDPAAGEDPDAWLDIVDGLVLAAGADVDPDAYGPERPAQTTGPVP